MSDSACTSWWMLLINCNSRMALISQFECFIPKPECGRRFSTPANRRKHLRSKHRVPNYALFLRDPADRGTDYPENYFFSITNHGVRERDPSSLYETTQRPTSPHLIGNGECSGD